MSRKKQSIYMFMEVPRPTRKPDFKFEEWEFFWKEGIQSHKIKKLVGILGRSCWWLN